MARAAAITGLITAAFLVTAAPAFAQEDSDDAGWNCKDPQAQQEMNQCAYVEQERADKELNTVYAEAIARAKTQDADYADLGPNYVGAEKALRQSQRAWIQNRDAFCSGTAITFEGGSIQPLIIATCLAQLTRSRIEELKTYADL